MNLYYNILLLYTFEVNNALDPMVLAGISVHLVSVNDDITASRLGRFN